MLRLLARVASPIAGFVALVAISTGGGIAPARAANDIQGSVNCDASVTTLDLIDILRSSAALDTNARCVQSNGDVNCDGKVNAGDGLVVEKYLAGIGSATAGCAAIGATVIPQPTSFELIEAARLAHTIDDPTALEYEVFALWGDSRLPDVYKGDDRGEQEGADITAKVLQGYDTLSAAQTAAVDPYLKRPDEPGSWITSPSAGSAVPQGGITWQKFEAVGGKVQVWAQDRYPGDAEKAQAIATAMTDTIWPKLTGLMNREPRNDHGLANNGGSDALDIYLIHAPRDSDGDPKFLGRTEYANPAVQCQEVPNYLLVDSLGQKVGSLTPPGTSGNWGMVQTTAHEFFHTLQQSYKYKTGCWANEYRWFLEASATWAENYTYPGAQSEQVYAEDFLNVPAQSVDTLGDNHEYGAYLFPYFLEKTEPDGAAIVRYIFEEFSVEKSLDAIHTQVSGEYTDVWGQFAVWNWNQTPVTHYKDLDSMTEGATPFTDPAQDVHVDNYDAPANLLSNSAVYHDFTVHDNDVKSVIFENPLPEETNPLAAGARVWGIAKVDGAWKAPEDWTQESRKFWCQDDERLDELVIIVGYADPEKKGPLVLSKQPKVRGKAEGCTAWEGTAQGTIHQGGFVFTSTMKDIHFEPQDPQPRPGEGLYYDLTRIGLYEWTASGQNNNCTISGKVHASTQVAVNKAFGFLTIVFNGDDPDTYHGIVTTWYKDGEHFVLVCSPDNEPRLGDFPEGCCQVFYTGFPEVEDQEVLGSSGEPRIQGTASATTCLGNNCTGTWHWNLRPAPPD